jgi:hypothetical protein
MKALRFDAEAPVQGSGIKQASGLKRASGIEQDTGFAQLGKGHTQKPVDKLYRRAQRMAA